MQYWLVFFKRLQILTSGLIVSIFVLLIIDKYHYWTIAIFICCHFGLIFISYIIVNWTGSLRYSFIHNYCSLNGLYTQIKQTERVNISRVHIIYFHVVAVLDKHKTLSGLSAPTGAHIDKSISYRIMLRYSTDTSTIHDISWKQLQWMNRRHHIFISFARVRQFILSRLVPPYSF